MPIPSHRETATIIAFPQKVQERRRPRSLAGDVVDLAERQLPLVDFGSGWYHEAAMQEEAAKRQN